MIVECQNCQTRFNVDPSRIKEGGSKVKCSNCGHIFKIFRPAPEPMPEPPAPPEEPLVEAAGPEPALAAPAPAQAPAQALAEDKEDFDFGQETGDDDLSGFGDDLDQPTAGPAPEEPGDDGDGVDFSSFADDLDMGEPSFEPPAEPEDGFDFGEEVGDDDMDFGGLADDLDLGEPGPAGEPETAAAGEFGPAEDDLDFGGLDDDLGLEEPEAQAEGPQAGTDDLDDLDFDGLDDAFGLPEDEEEAGPDQAGEPSLDEGDDVFGDLDLGEETAPGLDDDHGFNFGDNTILGDEPMEEDEELGDEEDDISYMGDYDDVDGADFSAEFAKPKAKKKRGCLWVLIFVFLVLAVLAGVFFYSPHLLDPVLKPLGLLTEEPQSTDDPQGNKYISPENAKHFFRQNEKEGQLLVITGLAKNHYPMARSFIRLKGLLHDAKGQVLAEKQVYCGNLLTEEELSTMSMEEIQKRLNARGGQEGENVNVQPGQSVRFMIVFNQIPIDLAEYTVEAFSSEPADSK